MSILKALIHSYFTVINVIVVISAYHPEASSAKGATMDMRYMNSDEES
jgi:hypothetical protein